MTEDTQLTLEFENLRGKRVVADFEGGNVSSDGGLLLLRSLERKLGVVRRLCAALVEKRREKSVEHPLEELVRQRVLQIACGYEDANDCDQLRSDPALKVACGRLPFSEEDLSSQPTMSRFENRVHDVELERLEQSLIDLFVAGYRQAPQDIILDIDDTFDETYGAQQMTLFNAFENGYGYAPIHIYEGHSGKLVMAVLRSAKTPSGAEIVRVLSRTVERIRQYWPRVRILVRGDSHYSAPEVHDYCEQNGLSYVFGQNPNKVIQAYAPVERLRAQRVREGKDVVWFGERQYQAGTWARARRVIIKAVASEKEVDVRAIVTNVTWRKAASVYWRLYCPRGQMENYIKNHKTVLASDRTSCHEFNANRVRLLLHSAAYVLLHALQERALRRTQLAVAQFDTIQKKLLRVGVRVVESTRKVLLHLPTSYPYRQLFVLAHQRLVPALR
jgi:hypothetical protein